MASACRISLVTTLRRRPIRLLMVIALPTMRLLIIILLLTLIRLLILLIIPPLMIPQQTTLQQTIPQQITLLSTHQEISLPLVKYAPKNITSLRTSHVYNAQPPNPIVSLVI